MRVLRGRASDPETDHQGTLDLAERVAETGEPGLRVWTPHRQVAFGRRDRRSDGYSEAKQTAHDQGYAVTEREVGGRAVAFTENTVAFVFIEPVDDHRTGIQERYDRTTTILQEALADCGVDAEPGEPRDSFCPGSHSLQTDDGKVVGLAQRVRQDLAAVGGVVVVDPAEVLAIIDPVYDALGIPFDPESVGTLAAGETPLSSARLIDAVAAAFADTSATDAASVRET